MLPSPAGLHVKHQHNGPDNKHAPQRKGSSEDKPHAKPKPFAPEGSLASEWKDGKVPLPWYPLTGPPALLLNPIIRDLSRSRWYGAAWGGCKPRFPSELPVDQAQGVSGLVLGSPPSSSPVLPVRLCQPPAALSGPNSSGRLCHGTSAYPNIFISFHKSNPSLSAPPSGGRAGGA